MTNFEVGFDFRDYCPELVKLVIYIYIYSDVGGCRSHG